MSLVLDPSLRGAVIPYIYTNTKILIITIQGLDFEVLLIVDWTLMLESFSLGLYHGFFKLSECRCQCTET